MHERLVGQKHKALKMNFRKLVTITCIGVITLAFAATPLHAKPKEEKGNNGKPKVKVPKPEKGNQSLKISKKNSTPANIKVKNVSRDHTIHKEKDASQSKALRPIVQDRLDRRAEHSLRKSEQMLIRDLNRSLLRLNQSNWSYHPRDDRGQGNMGKVDMLDPFGHDKDSDRKELYGTRGRVIKEIIPEPEPEPPIEPEPEPPPEPDPPPEPEPPPEPDPIPEFPF